jgi:hypothetical protein
MNASVIRRSSARANILGGSRAGEHDPGTDAKPWLTLRRHAGKWSTVQVIPACGNTDGSQAYHQA